MASNAWFKHYNKAHEGQTISELWTSNQAEVIAFYWTILELVSLWESEESRGQLTLKFSTIRAKLGMNSQRCLRLLQKLSESFRIEVHIISKESFKVSIPNWLELQETKTQEYRGKSKSNTTTTSPRPKIPSNIGEQINTAWDVWNETRSKFGLPAASISMPQQYSIARAIPQLGFENVCLALEGQRHEPKTDTFSPRDHLSVDRVLHKDAKGISRWEKFVNLAQAARADAEQASNNDSVAQGSA